MRYSTNYITFIVKKFIFFNIQTLLTLAMQSSAPPLNFHFLSKNAMGLLIPLTHYSWSGSKRPANLA